MSDVIVVEQENTVVVTQAENTVTVVHDTPAVTIAAGAVGPKGDTGPAGPVAGTDKQVIYNDAGSAGASAAFRYDKNSQTLLLGVEGEETFPNNPIIMRGAVNDYYQAIVHNTTEGVDASSDFVATADNGTDENYYIDVGINSSVYANEDYTAMGPNAAYVMAVGGELVLCSDKDRIDIAVGGTLSENVTGSFTETGLEMEAGQSVSVGGVALATVTNRPEILSGTGDAPSAVGLADGTLYFKYT